MDQARRRPMNLIEKIIAANAVDLESINDIKPGNVVVLRVSWVLSSEASWVGIDKTFSQLGRPALHRKDRVWLAQDHTVDPRINSRPKVRKTIELAEAAAKELGIVDYYGPNYTIMHTEFCRERAQPGQVIVGSDSHTCSAGSLGALAIGLGAADVTIPMITGETWLTVPPTLCINFVNKPPFGIGGKDIILHVLGQLKRNTVAANRAVEFTGPGLKYLSCDARFAISNMTTEFGGLAGVFVADEITAAYLKRRKRAEHRDHGLYFQPDKDAEYAETFTIDLAQVDSVVALYPSPDNVVPIQEVVGKSLDGCFIGACTTAEEDLILASLVLRQGLKEGLVSVGTGKRKVTPGSIPILNRLREIGLLHWFEKAGFEIGAPGCSYCVGVAADIAGAGEVWLSSQNRNFPNRMGPGSFANLSSAATVAASSFSMKVTDPASLLSSINRKDFDELRQLWVDELPAVSYSEPKISHPAPESPVTTVNAIQNGTSPHPNHSLRAPEPEPSVQSHRIEGKCITFGDNIDTDAIIPAQALLAPTDEALGEHAFEHILPTFHKLVNQAGQNIIIAGHAFGCGSSREEAPRAIKGAGVKAVIAKSFAFIYSRNQPNLALLGIVISDESFYQGLVNGSDISIDLVRKVVIRQDTRSEYPFRLSSIEEALVLGGGVAETYKRAGSKLFQKLLKQRKTRSVGGGGGGCGGQTHGSDFGSGCGSELGDHGGLQGPNLAW